MEDHCAWIFSRGEQFGLTPNTRESENECIASELHVRAHVCVFVRACVG